MCCVGGLGLAHHRCLIIGDTDLAMAGPLFVLTHNLSPRTTPHQIPSINHLPSISHSIIRFTFTLSFFLNYYLLFLQHAREEAANISSFTTSIIIIIIIISKYFKLQRTEQPNPSFVMIIYYN